LKVAEAKFQRSLRDKTNQMETILEQKSSLESDIENLKLNNRKLDQYSKEVNALRESNKCLLVNKQEFEIEIENLQIVEQQNDLNYKEKVQLEVKLKKSESQLKSTDSENQILKNQLENLQIEHQKSIKSERAKISRVENDLQDQHCAEVDLLKDQIQTISQELAQAKSEARSATRQLDQDAQKIGLGLTKNKYF
jgi:chromosome segregation ATPase